MKPKTRRASLACSTSFWFHSHLLNPKNACVSNAGIMYGTAPQCPPALHWFDRDMSDEYYKTKTKPVAVPCLGTTSLTLIKFGRDEAHNPARIRLVPRRPGRRDPHTRAGPRVLRPQSKSPGTIVCGFHDFTAPIFLLFPLLPPSRIRVITVRSARG
eukprot:COSAG05_NODE_143_length_16570_cov_12.041953_13_plen_157_part_00